MKVIVIGGTGHVGKFMAPMLVEAGCEVTVVGTGKTPVPKTNRWAKIKYITFDVNDEKSLEQIRDLHPEVVVNMPGDTWLVYQKLKKHVKHVIGCGSLWMLGEPVIVPTPETLQTPPVFYTQRMEYFLKMLEESAKGDTAFTGILPPNICGPGKIPLECVGGRNIEVHKQHAAGMEVILPDGPDALIGPCDAEDIAQCFLCAVLNPDKAASQMFNVGSAYALTATQFVAAYGKIYDKQIPIKRVSWRQYIEKISPGKTSWWHFKAHMCPDISKAKTLLGYKPRYTPEQTLARAVEWMRKERLL
ncbi:MAG: NAD(P)-dependent oxidoreductase [Planctomycetota bacterium]